MPEGAVWGAGVTGRLLPARGEETNDQRPLLFHAFLPLERMESCSRSSGSFGWREPVRVYKPKIPGKTHTNRDGFIGYSKIILWRLYA
mgnify:CR=1 FL=1